MNWGNQIYLLKLTDNLPLCCTTYKQKTLLLIKIYKNRKRRI